ncbi:hypothetical protein Alg130_09709 [Pyrenophora tritici-repentis]|nr:hypothetical protein Alg130_09709 [Pyrenophora tritici-repentis]KAI0604948.1 hypothetical protein TUN205_10802 [Pyrenophora tritici-repentis]KAI1572988.1 hypothetical protein PtrEW7m1_007334 [Pyrenophora tritici-repentis]
MKNMFEEVQREKYRDEIDYNTLKPPAAIWAAYKTNRMSAHDQRQDDCKKATEGEESNQNNG